MNYINCESEVHNYFFGKPVEQSIGCQMFVGFSINLINLGSLLYCFLWLFLSNAAPGLPSTLVYAHKQNIFQSALLIFLELFYGLPSFGGII